MIEQNVIKPSHYNQGDMDLIEAWYHLKPFNEFAASMEFNIIKYTLRWRDKNGLEDLQKAEEYKKRLAYYTELSDSIQK
ncbi:DUF3310 domain-containing protein [Enterococcus sp. N249-2]